MNDQQNLTILSVAGSDGVRAAVEAWTAAGLLRRSVWLDPAALEALPAHLMGMPVHLVDRDEAGTRALNQVFGTGQYKVVRVVAVRQLGEDGVPDDLTARLWAFAARLDVGGGDIVLINLVVPGQTPVTAKGLLEPGWHVNVVVSPEDRPREGAVDHGFDGAAEFDAHTALAAITVGALWDRTESGPFDEQRDHATGKLGTIAVVRAAARVLDARRLPKAIVTQVLGKGATSLSRYLPRDPQRVADDEALVGAMFEAFLPVQDSTLYYHERRPPVPPTPRILPLTLRKLPRFWAQLTILKLEQASRAAFARLDPEAEQWLQRFVGGAVFRPSPEEMIDCASGAPESLRPNPLLPQVAPPYEFVWPALRQLCFGLVDGGVLPVEVREKVHGLQPRVGNARWVVPHPDEGLGLPVEVRRILKELGLPGDGVRAGDSNAIDRLEQRLLVARGVVAAQVTGEERQREADLAAIDKCGRDLRRWRRDGRWERSLVGRLAGHLSDQIAIAEDALQRRRAAYEQEKKERDTILCTLDRVHDQMWWFLSLVLMLVVGTVAWLSLSVGGRLALVVGLPVLVVGVGGWVLWLAAYAASLETRLLQVEARRKATVAAVKEWPSEAVRLGSLYEILVDWGEIMGRLLHRPFGETAVDPTPEADAGPRTPEALRLGESVVTAERVHDLATLAVRDAFNAGWVGRLYAAVLDATFPDLGDDPGARNPENDPDKSPAPPRSRIAADAAMAGLAAAGVPAGAAKQDGDEDGAEEDGAEEDGEEDGEPARPHARERLLQSFRSPDGAAAVAMRYATAATRAALLRLPAGTLLSGMTVREAPAGNEPEPDSGAELAADAFLMGAMPNPGNGAPCLALAPMLFSDSGMVNGRTAVARVHLWGTRDQPVVEDLAAPEHQQILREDGRSAGGDPEQCRFSLIRLDVADCEETDLAFPL
jgi:hypothetical protein